MRIARLVPVGLASVCVLALAGWLVGTQMATTAQAQSAGPEAAADFTFALVKEAGDFKIRPSSDAQVVLWPGTFDGKRAVVTIRWGGMSGQSGVPGYSLSVAYQEGGTGSALKQVTLTPETSVTIVARSVSVRYAKGNAEGLSDEVEMRGNYTITLNMAELH